jgi:hypothetical protein
MINAGSFSALLLIAVTLWAQNRPDANVAIHYFLYILLFSLCCFRVYLGITNKENEHSWSYNSISLVFFIYVFFGIISPIRATTTVENADVPFTLMVLLLYILILIQFRGHLFDFVKIKDLQNNFLAVLLAGGFIIFQFSNRSFGNNSSLTTLRPGFIATFLSIPSLSILFILMMLLTLAGLYKKPTLLASWQLVAFLLTLIIVLPLVIVWLDPSLLLELDPYLAQNRPLSQYPFDVAWLFFYVILSYVIASTISLKIRHISLISAVSTLVLVLIYYKKQEPSIYKAVTMLHDFRDPIQNYIDWIIIVGTIFSFIIPAIGYMRSRR